MDKDKFLEECKKLAGDNGGQHSYCMGLALENLANPENARSLIIKYATPSIGEIEIRSLESPWSDNFGDTDRLKVPVLYINGELASQEGWKYKEIMQYALENLKLNKTEERTIKKGLEKIASYNKLYEEMVGS
ncbi:MAG: hypothetical protein ACP5OG_00610 [Candidatus Nanoarchaeia archaeon]